MRIWPFRSSTVETKASLVNPDDWLKDIFGILPTATGISVTATSALTVPAVSAAVRTISEAVASLDINVVEIGTGRVETPLTDHPVLDLLTGDANEWTDGFSLIRDLVADALRRDQGGLAWVNWVNNKPAEIIRFPIGQIGVDFDQTTFEPRYRIGNTPSFTSSQNIVHVRPPFDKAPVTLAREAIGVAAVMERHAAKLFSNGARPGGVIRTTKSLGDQGVKNMLKAWKAAHDGADNAGKTAILFDGAEWQQLTLNSVDSQFQELRLFQLQEIARAFNLPPSMIGDLSRATWSNSEQKGREFLSYCLEPWLRIVEGALRRALFLPEDRKRYAVRFDRDDLTRADLTARATAISSLITSRAINPNEARSWLGLGPRTGGDEYANPNTGSSQPGGMRNSAQTPPKPDEDTDGPE
jgi:HK97 family phage portal protein